jgi:hypothetical protein
MSCHFLGTDFTGEKGHAAKGLCREREKNYAMVRRLMPQIREASLSQKAATPKKVRRVSLQLFMNRIS